MMRRWTEVQRVAAFGVLMAACSPVFAQSPADFPPPGPARPGGPNAAGAGPSAVPPIEALRMLRSTGYSILSRPRPAGVLYSIAVITPGGDDGRIYMDSRDGRLVRFVPGYALTPRTDEQIELAYNPPGPPPSADTPRRPPPPAAAPKTASRTTGVAINPARPAAPKPPPAAKPAETAAAPAPVSQTQGAATKPVEARPDKPALVIQPTQEAPPALGLE